MLPGPRQLLQQPQRAAPQSALPRAAAPTGAPLRWPRAAHPPPAAAMPASQPTCRCCCTCASRYAFPSSSSSASSCSCWSSASFPCSSPRPTAALASRPSAPHPVTSRHPRGIRAGATALGGPATCRNAAWPCLAVEPPPGSYGCEGSSQESGFMGSRSRRRHSSRLAAAAAAAFPPGIGLSGSSTTTSAVGWPAASRRTRAMVPAAVGSAAPLPSPGQGYGQDAGPDTNLDLDLVDKEEDPDLYLGPSPDIVAAMDTLSRVAQFGQLQEFVGANRGLLGGPEVAAVVLQAANVAEKVAMRQMMAAVRVAEKRAAEAEKGRGGGEGGDGDLTQDVLVGAFEDILKAGARAPSETAAATAAATILPGVSTSSSTSSGGGGSAGGDKLSPLPELLSSLGARGSVLSELQAADEVLEWATPLLRQHIKRYAPDTVVALVSALAELRQYDERLMELVSETFKANPEGWLERATRPVPALPRGVEGQGWRQGQAQGSDGSDAAAMAREYGGGSGSGAMEPAVGADPWVLLTSLARAFARLGYYDPELMDGIAELAVALMPSVSERADRADLYGNTDDGDAYSSYGSDVWGDGATDTVVSLVCSFHELQHLHPGLMQAAGEHLATYAHQLDAGAAAATLQAYAAFNARNPPFYTLLLRRVVEAPREGMTPRGVGMLYRACVLLSAEGDVPCLSPRPAPAPAAAYAAYAAAAASSSSPTTPAAAVQTPPPAPEGYDQDKELGSALFEVLLEYLSAFPLPEMRVTYLARPSLAEIEEADEELMEAWDATGLLVPPDVQEALKKLPLAEGEEIKFVPEESLTAPPEEVHRSIVADVTVVPYEEPWPPSTATVAGDVATDMVPADALFLYGVRTTLGKIIMRRIAVKILDDRHHCCQNVADLSYGSTTEVEAEVVGGEGKNGGAAAPFSLRLRGPALAELQCLEKWGWRVLVVPVSAWSTLRELEEEDAAAEEGEEDDGVVGPRRLAWLLSRLRTVAEVELGAGTGAAGGLLGPELQL